ncbi:formin-like protein 18 [Tanacetum coccineum]|uniref:Formin-like protein 18 n=1 Tax=Tanacetum coccineum TaxID=301880 RepID=A0ABQ5CYY0_9ASTR
MVVLPCSSRTGLLPSGRVDLTGDEDPTDEDGDHGMGDLTRVSMSLGCGISLGGNKSRESNIGDSDNTRDGYTTDEKERENLACIYSYINHLIEFKDKRSGFSSAKHHKLPNILTQKFNDMFANTIPKNNFEVLKLLENSVEALKIRENKLESMKILENKLESLKLQENQLVDGYSLGGKKKLPIKFDVLDQKTVKPVGENNHNFTGLIGNEIERVVPFCFKSWEDVPDKYKTTLWPTLKHYFDLAEHLTGPRAKDIEAGIKLSFKARYKSRKHNFHQREFVGRDGYIEPIKIRDFPPEDVELDHWHKYCDMVTSEKWKKRSNANKSNRAKQVYSSNHGTKSYAQSRFEEYNEETGTFPDLVEQFKKKHTKAGKWNSPVAKTKYNEMIAIREAQEGQEGTCLTDAEIVSRVLGESRSFLPGRGRRLPLSSGASSSSVHSHPTGPLLSQEAWARAFTASQDQLSGMYQQLIAANIPVTQPAPLDPHQFVGDEVATGPLLSQEAWARAFAASQDQLSALYQQLIAANIRVTQPAPLDPRQFVEVTDAREDAPERE